MEKKIKFILIGLVGLLCVFFFIILQSNVAKQAIEREKNNLVKEAESLARQNESISQEIKRLQEQRSSLERQLEKTSRDKADIETKYGFIVKERDALIEKLKAKPVVTEMQRVAIPQTDDAYWAQVLKAKTDLELQLENIRVELKTMQINNEQLQREKSTSELDLKNLSRENDDLKRQIEYNQKIMDTLSQELVREKNDKFKIQDSFKSIKSENGILRRQLKSLDSRKINLERNFVNLQKENTQFDARLKEMEALLQEKMLQMDNLRRQLAEAATKGGARITAQEKESVELPPIVVRPQEPEASQAVSPSSLAGKILAVNKENNFVIIDLGEDAGVKLGDTFKVYRRDDVIASLEVIQVRKQIAACDIAKETIPIKVGDTIR